MMFYESTQIRVLLLLACALLVVVFKSNGRQSHAQSRPERTSARAPGQAGGSADVVRLSAPTKPASGAGLKGVNPAAFDAAASTNALLQTSLEWSFGGKLQRGWHLYTPLIADLIGAAANAGASEFAMRLSLWQQQNGIEPTGALERQTWSQMVSRFQSRRISIRRDPEPNQLVTIPVSDCYDPTRVEELRSAERETYAAYKRMVAAAAADPSLELQVARNGQLAWTEKFLKIISAFRSREHQEQLRQQSPNSGRAGLAVNSPHFTGRALDLYVGGEPVSTKDENRAVQTRSAVYHWLVRNAARYGFQPYFFEPWHWEYVGVRRNVAR